MTNNTTLLSKYSIPLKIVSVATIGFLGIMFGITMVYSVNQPSRSMLINQTLCSKFNATPANNLNYNIRFSGQKYGATCSNKNNTFFVMCDIDKINIVYSNLSEPNVTIDNITMHCLGIQDYISSIETKP